MERACKPVIIDLHIPYCIRPEKYQNHFGAVGTNEEKNAYLRALRREVLSWEGELDGYEVLAVRLSGGSATVMHPDMLGDVLYTVREHLPVARAAEVSFDALPNTIGTPSMTGIGGGRPNRVELMMRSEDDRELHALNCAFSYENVQNAMLFFEKFHMNNVGLTVNYGIPGQTMVSWHNTLHACVIMNPAHISVEPLCVTDAPGMPDAAARFEMYAHACQYLKEQGYVQYGARHFCLPHHEYVFEALKMDGADVIGMGVDAVSAFDGYVTRNTNNLALYVKNAGDMEKLTAKAYELDNTQQQLAYAVGRTTAVSGLRMAAFEARFGMAVPEEIKEKLSALADKGFIENGDAGFVPTVQGLFHAEEMKAVILSEKAGG